LTVAVFDLAAAYNCNNITKITTQLAPLLLVSNKLQH